MLDSLLSCLCHICVLIDLIDVNLFEIFVLYHVHLGHVLSKIRKDEPERKG